MLSLIHAVQRVLICYTDCLHLSTLSYAGCQDGTEVYMLTAFCLLIVDTPSLVVSRLSL